MTSNETRQKVIKAARVAVDQLIKVAKEEIIKTPPKAGSETPPEDSLAADKLRNAAATKKLAIFDAFEILNRIDVEEESLRMSESGASRTDTKQGFAERRSK
jgi:hypothetical protein